MSRAAGELSMIQRAEARDLMRYSAASEDLNPIHLDAEAARRAGLDDCVVHGMLIMAWSASAISELAGQDAQIRRIKMRFRAPLYVGQDATVEVVAAPTDGDDSADVNYQVTVHGPDGSTVASGSATTEGGNDYSEDA